MSERLQFIQACLDRRVSIVEVCREFQISEKTGHKWLARFRAEGPAGLEPRSHAPHGSPGALTPGLALELLAFKRRHRGWGPRKLRDRLMQLMPERAWPAASTIGALLKRHGLVRPRRRARGVQHARLEGRTSAHAPNAVWTADFKGEFRLRADGSYCYPLTVMDLHSHYLLRCCALPSTAVVPARRVFERLFREHGLPAVLRTDNGVPFAQPNAIGRLGALGFWWARLGIRPEHITPARPAENGAHERFHRTLKAQTQPAAATLAAQQQRFDRFRVEYNTERPHESLPAHVPPAQMYTPSPRAYPTRLAPLDYPEATAIRRVDAAGVIKWQNHPVFLSTNLAGEDVGLHADADDTLIIHYAALILGRYDPHDHRFTAHVRWGGAPT